MTMPDQFKQRGGALDGQVVQPHTNEYKELIVANGLPTYAEWVRRGKVWRVKTTTAFAPIAAIPTTTARLELYNPLGGNESIVLIGIYAFQLLSTAATQTYSLWAQVTQAKAAPTAASLLMASANGKDPVSSATGSFVVAAVDTTVGDLAWQCFGSVQSWGTAAATPGNGWYAPVDGMLIAPPGHSICVAVAGSIATASSFQCGAVFAHVTLDNVTS